MSKQNKTDYASFDLSAQSSAELKQIIADNKYLVDAKRATRPTKGELISAILKGQKNIKKEKAPPVKEEKTSAAKKEKTTAVKKDETAPRVSQKMIVQAFVKEQHADGKSRHEILSGLVEQYNYTENTAATKYSIAMRSLGLVSVLDSQSNPVHQWLLEHPKSTREQFVKWATEQDLAYGTIKHYWKTFQFAIKAHTEWSK